MPTRHTANRLADELREVSTVKTVTVDSPDQLYVQLSSHVYLDAVIIIGEAHGYLPAGITETPALRLKPTDNPEVVRQRENAKR